jgi:adenylate cyclase
LKQHIVRIALGLIITLLFVVHAAKIRNVQIGLVNQLDNIIYDTRLRLTMPGGVDDRIVILDIDERSLDPRALGRWPWGRDKILVLLQKLFDKYGVAVAGFDVVFAEPDEGSGLPVLERLAKSRLKDVSSFQSALAELRPQLDHDARFASFLRGRPVVLGYYFNHDDNALESGVLPAPVLDASTLAGRNVSFISGRGYGANLPEFQANAAGAGHFNPRVDDDGVSRRVPILYEYKGKYYEALSLAMVRVYLGLRDAARLQSQTVTLPRVTAGIPPDRFIAAKGYSGLEWLEVGPLAGTQPLVIPVDDEVSALVPYRGPRGSYPYISLADVYFDRVPADKLKGKIALIGTSAPGLQDLRSTPVGSVYPGVEIHANLIAGMLDRSLKQKPPYMLGAEVLLVIVGGVVLSILVPFLSPLRATLVSLSALVLITALNLGVWSGLGMVLPLAASVLMTITLFVINMAYGYFIEARGKRQFTELFGQYVPPELVDKMAEDPESALKYNMEPRAAELTILFSDVRDFTRISETLSPEDLREYINEYLTQMSDIIRGKHRGTLDKYIGDAIMAFWGAPMDDKNHARNGVLAALEMQRQCPVLNEKFAARGWPPLKVGIGVNSGSVRVGDMGSKLRRAYTVMGDPVNAASRIEGRTKSYGVDILVGEATRRQVTDVVFREIDRIKVKGKNEAITVYEPIGLESEVDKKVLDELKLWQQTLRSYRTQQWDQAEVNLLNLQRMNPECPLYRIYADKVAEYRRKPLPAEWDGVTVFEEK